MEAYGDFSEVYDEFMDNVPYEEWAERLDELIQKYGVTDKKPAVGISGDAGNEAAVDLDDLR